MADPDLENDLLALERRGWDSLCDGTGDVVYGALMTDDAVMVLANGQVMDRDTVVAALGHAPPWSRYDISDVRVLELGADTAALVYLGTASRAAEPVFAGLMTSVYVRRGGAWRLALYQQTQRPADDS